MSKCFKATPEELEQLIRSNSTGLGRSFELLCKFCRDVGSISANRRTYLSKEHKRKAAEKFAKQCWRIEDGISVCPACFVRRNGWLLRSGLRVLKKLPTAVPGRGGEGILIAIMFRLVRAFDRRAKYSACAFVSFTLFYSCHDSPVYPMRKPYLLKLELVCQKLMTSLQNCAGGSMMEMW